MSATNLKESIKSQMSADEEQARRSRDREITRASAVGIGANLLLAALKAVIGTLTGSIAITMDAVNNVSDAASSVITVVGVKLAARPADSKHPFGYGRIEYLSAAIISLIVLYAGITSLVESARAIVSPEAPEYSLVPLVIVAIGVLVKVALGRYVTAVGRKVNSDSLVNSGKDATLDSVISASTLVAALVFIFAHVSLEAWLGAAISLVIVKSGVDMLRETLSEILGESADAGLARDIKRIATSFDEVRGAYDVVLNNYGPDAFVGSLHIEVADTLDADRIDSLTRKITSAVALETGVILTGVSVYAYNTRDPRAVEMRDRVTSAVMAHEHITEIHGFHVDFAEKTIRFDLVVSFAERDRAKLFHEVCGEVQRLYPDFTLRTTMDTDFSEEV